MSKIDEVMEIKALRRVISAYLKFVFSVFFLLCFVFIIKNLGIRRVSPNVLLLLLHPC